MAYAIVQEHGGRIRLESRPGAGASFFVELPVAGAKMTTVSEPASLGRKTPIEVVAGASMLVVEDEAQLAAAVTESLRDAGYNVEHAADGEQALERVGRANLRSRGLRLEDAAGGWQGVLSRAVGDSRRSWPNGSFS